jgi:PKD domain/Bacterial Ig-like domain
VSLSGTAGATTTSVSQSGPMDGTTYDVAVSGMTSDGTVIASIPAGSNSPSTSGAQDAAGNGNQASTSTDNSVTCKGSKPSVTIDQAAGQTDPTNASPINFTVVFSESVSDFASGDVTLGGGAGATTATVTGSGTTYNVAVSGMTNDGPVTASISADKAHDSVGNGNTASTSTDNSVTYDKTAPTVTINQGATQSDPATTQPIHFTAFFSEPVSGFTNTSVTLSGCSGAMANVYDANQATPDHKTYDIRVNNLPNTSCTVTASIAANKAQDAAGNGNSGSTSTDNSVTWQPTVGNAAPVVTVDSPAFGTVYAKGSAAINPLTVKAHFSDPDSSTSWTYTINWDDNNAVSTGSATPSPATFQASHNYTAAGVYTINVCAKDNQGASGCAQVWIVVYDASAGFVTGGGWLNVDSQSYCTVCGVQTGRANFGFNSQYKKGANVPTGETEFNFSDGNMNFHSTAYTWLVVSGYKAQYKGTGTINGSGNYEFTLTAYDGDITGGGGVDRFRIRITGANNGAVVFDNRYKNSGGGLEPTDMDTADPEAISGGSIVIHKA